MQSKISKGTELLSQLRDMIRSNRQQFQASDPSLLDELIDEQLNMLTEELARSDAQMSVMTGEVDALEQGALKMRRAKGAISRSRHRNRSRDGLVSPRFSKEGISPGPAMIRMLLVEDDQFQGQAIQLLCQRCGYTTLSTANASDALGILKQNPDINLVLCDVMMEGTTGYELLQQIRALRNSVAVLMVSAYESIDLVEKCILAGADAYLIKPLRAHELRNIWQYAWRRRHESILSQQQQQLRARTSKPDLDSAQKVKGQWQQLRAQTIEEEEVTSAVNQLDKLEANTLQQSERKVKMEMHQLLCEGATGQPGVVAIVPGSAGAPELSPVQEDKPGFDAPPSPSRGTSRGMSSSSRGMPVKEEYAKVVADATEATEAAE
eukprot:CAMPEP_0119356870 /NCGR_PEP_ID=MMETSP1334-20130426/5383_1 /TAXON_ID=127549 /ORGANISM="Calcidiscus leptoporus, Strain RCC1130" /LENGTH=378 /DNA_ID=CAMNT_0007370999 /DNA_START=180 /DNA_END=1313 /DNA_ORIENTATION=+